MAFNFYSAGSSLRWSFILILDKKSQLLERKFTKILFLNQYTETLQNPLNDVNIKNCIITYSIQL